MRIVFGVLSLLIVVAIVGVLAKKQLGSPVPASATAPANSGVVVPTGTPQQQVDQVKKSVENALQQSRPVNDETK
jgi:Na+-transporting methylmalonyl-CoA/oxaloacetate decarboxylase gamma subunit